MRNVKRSQTSLEYTRQLLNWNQNVPLQKSHGQMTNFSAVLAILQQLIIFSTRLLPINFMRVPINQFNFLRKCGCSHNLNWKSVQEYMWTKTNLSILIYMLFHGFRIDGTIVMWCRLPPNLAAAINSIIYGINNLDQNTFDALWQKNSVISIRCRTQ